ncbi:hypothetical protein OAP24_01625 [Porticoccaceae bacterium]|nr:hypothetical protein [Porticoccaceae bacterium]
MSFSNKDTYKVVLTGHGGEYCLGTTTQQVVAYWCKRTTDELIHNLTNGNTTVDIPDEYNRYPYFDQTDIFHTHGVEVNNHNYLEVISAETQETVYEVALSSLREQMEMIDNPITGLEEGQPIIYHGLHEKGTWEYDLDIETEFDPKRLKFYLHYLQGTLVVDSVEYDGRDIEFWGGNTRTINLHASFGRIIDTDGEYKSLV